ncbi:MAG: malto-oligosyltrehalose trehalohydrolase [Chloroflexota bacterium]
MDTDQKLGADYLGGGRCRFLVWAPLAQRVQLHLIAPNERWVAMEKVGQGYHRAMVEGVEPGYLYRYCLGEGKERPDPASRSQPHGVHGPSQVVESSFPWTDNSWPGLPLDEYLIYEIHVGTFTPEGTFDAIIPHLDYLKALGITAVEIMPVAQFPGDRNWGYDGVFPFAVQNSYGGPWGLKRLVDACHGRGIAVVLDVVYNHLGPEGNYLWDYGPYFTDKYRTPWGPAINFDGRHSDDVRRFFLENALYWVTDFHLDALRLDAVHAIFDQSALPFLQELAVTVQQRGMELGRQILTIAESNLNDARIIHPREIGGYGLDAQWSDDLHHALHTILTGERNGYYQDFGSTELLARAYRDGYAYTGQYSHYRQHRHGNSPRMCKARQFVVCSQNHDQIGNRMMGERLTQLVSLEGLKLAAGVVLLSPYIPLLFMGEEYGETAPFQYFISHLDSELVEAVRRGRREEFSSFAWHGDAPDPQDPATFIRSKLDLGLRGQGHHRVILEYYRELIRLRKTVPALACLNKERMEVLPFEEELAMLARRWSEGSEVAIIFNFNDGSLSADIPIPSGKWRKLLDSSESRWGGAGSPTPELLISDGNIHIPIAPKTLVLLSKEAAH